MKLFNLLILGCLVLGTSCSTSDRSNDIEAIKTVMKAQQMAWNNYDLERFMDGYWKNDSLKFYGSNGLTSGWDKTLSNYKKRYPDRSHTGSLRFILDEISEIDKDSYYVMGQYNLTREMGDARGVFLIIFRRINGEWKIIADLSC
ncbi:MAG: nuclear transport factor 2 family protein [Flavobacteriaceae bacterium]|nr:nuclear transport factor 2 family protein [Bacteroidia bacterium]NNK88789.1 nuclear transport factor 2 family protein [Flavobacteriaceae bacterium]